MTGKEVLSDSELEALMETVAEGDAESGVSATGEYRLFDFAARRQCPLEEYSALHTVHEKMSFQLADELKSLCRCALDVVGADLEVVSLGEAQAALPELVALNLIQTPPISGRSLVVLPGETLSGLVNLYFGGPEKGTSFKATRTHLTPIERRVNDLVIERFMASLMVSWREIAKLAPETEKFETNPDFLQMGAAASQCVVFHYQVRAQEWMGSLKWLVPISDFEAIKAKLGRVETESHTSQQDQPQWESYFRKELLSVDVDISGQIGCQPMSLAQLLGLRHGSIIPLESPTDVVLFVEDEAFCNGEYGAFSGKKSVKIRGLAKSDE